MARSPRKSRKLSAGLLAKQPEPSPVLFIDRDTGGKKLAAELVRNGYKVELHGAHFNQATQDSLWIRTVSSKGWIILTCDRNIGRKEPEKSLFGTAPTYTFILYALSHAPNSERFQLVLNVLPKLLRIVEQKKSKGIYRVHTDGRIEYLANIKPKYRLEDF